MIRYYCCKDFIRSFYDTNWILAIIHACAKVQSILFLSLELNRVGIVGLWVLYIHKLSLYRIDCQGNSISLIVIPGSILLIYRWVFRPTVPIIRNLIASMCRCWLKFKCIALYFFADGHSNWKPSLYAFHLKLYRSLLCADAWLN